MADDEYELLPSAEIERLRNEVEKIKRNPLGDTQASISLLSSISSLNENITKLVSIFQSANDDLVRAYTDQSLQEQLRKLREENAKIAHGIVALSELIKDVQKTHPQMDLSKMQSSVTAMPPPLVPAANAMPAPPPVASLGSNLSEQEHADVAFHEDELMQDLKGKQNPFSDPLPQYQPILNQPLPKPGQQPRQDISFEEIPPPPPR